MSSSNGVLAAAPPTFLTRPPWVSSAGPEVVELARSAGLILDDWQEDVLDVGLAERADGKWSARQVGVLVPRQNGKGGDLEALELGGLYLFDDCSLIIHSAHEFATSAEAFRRLIDLIDNTDDLRRQVHKVHRAHGSEGVELLDGTRILFKTRTGGGGRGFSGDLVIYDEAYNLFDKAISALMPTLSARVNPQLWVTSSAPLETVESAVLRRFAKRGREGGDSLAYMEWCAPVTAAELAAASRAEAEAILDDRRHWAAANPAYPHRIDDEAIADERRMMLAVDFARERLGIWDATDDDEADDHVIPPAAWASSFSPASSIEGEPSFALEVAEDRSWSCFAAAGPSPLGGTHGEIITGSDPGYRRGTAWVVERAVRLQARHGGTLAVRNGSAAASLVADLELAGVAVKVVTVEEHARACGQLYDAVVGGTFRHLDQEALNIAVHGAERRDHGDAWVWAPKRSTVDISPLIAITIAAACGSVDPSTQIW